MCLYGIRRQISTAFPFNKISAIENFHEFVVVSKLIKGLVFQLGSNIKTADAAVVCNDA